MSVQETNMNMHIGNNGVPFARVIHDDPNTIEAFVAALRSATNISEIDWFYIVSEIAVIKVIGDLQVLRDAVMEILPHHPKLAFKLVA